MAIHKTIDNPALATRSHSLVNIRLAMPPQAYHYWTRNIDGLVNRWMLGYHFPEIDPVQFAGIGCSTLN